MKKIFYLFVSLVFMFTSCNPLEDLNVELAEATKLNGIVGDVSRTLSDDDYEVLELSYGNFSSEDDAKEMLPSFLSGQYPALGVIFKEDGSIKEASSATISYNLYAPKATEKDLEVYTVSSDDYADNGHSFGNFSEDNHITDFLDIKYPNAADRLLVSLTYKYYSGSVSTLNNGFLFVNGAWEMATGITDDEYTAMGEGYTNFSSEDEAIAKVAIFLEDKFKFSGKVASDIEAVMYKLYTDGSVKSFIANFIYDGTSWDEYTNTIDTTLKFGHDGNSWVPDNTIKYTLTNADFALVGNGSYNNFDVRDGKAEQTIEVRLVKLNTILKANFPSSAQGQKFSVTYAVYDGANGVRITNVVLEGSDYILQ